jgi:hypothetical protein
LAHQTARRPRDPNGVWNGAKTFVKENEIGSVAANVCGRRGCHRRVRGDERWSVVQPITNHQDFVARCRKTCDPRNFVSRRNVGGEWNSERYRNAPYRFGPVARKNLSRQALPLEVSQRFDRADAEPVIEREPGEQFAIAGERHIGCAKFRLQLL